MNSIFMKINVKYLLKLMVKYFTVSLMNLKIKTKLQLLIELLKIENISLLIQN